MKNYKTNSVYFSRLFFCVILTGLATASFFTACENPIMAELLEPITPPKNPTITSHPQNAKYNLNDMALPLTVSARGNDKGTLTFAWYSNTKNSNSGGTLINGEIGTSFTPPTDKFGIVYYYAVITNSKPDLKEKAMVASNTAKIEVSNNASAGTPLITSHPQSAVYTQGKTAVPLTVSVDVNGGGTLSYTWYRNTENSNIGGMAISNGDSYTPSTTALGIEYYYVIVTNINNGKTAVSNTAKIEVNTMANAAVPSIISFNVSPQGPYETGTTVTLTVSASSDGGLLSYEWYRNTADNNSGGTPISGATAAIFNPPTSSGGTFYYYAVVTNTITDNGDGGEKSQSIKTSPIAVVTIYNVGSQTQLAAIASDLSGNYKLSASFALSDTWTPIGTQSAPFTGTFDGNGKTISGLTISSSSSGYQGLFGCIGEKGVVENINLSNVSISGTSYTGGIAGCNLGIVQNCSVSGSVNSTSYAGGLVGWNGSAGSATVQNCCNTATVISTSGAGGIVGYNNKGDIKNCYNTGNIKGDAAGGITATTYETNTAITYCYNTGNIENPKDLYPAGGIVGRSISGSLVTISGVNNNVSLGSTVITVTSGRAGRVGGWVEGTDNKARADMAVNGSLVSGGTASNKDGADVAIGTSLSSVFNGWNTTTIWEMPSNTSLTVGGALPTLRGFASGVQSTPTLPAPGDIIINIQNISGVTAPVTGGSPVNGITATDQYTGNVSWSPTITDGKFAEGTPYTATITLAAKTGYTFTGVAENFFKVSGATTTNPANSGTITAKFPATASYGITLSVTGTHTFTAATYGYSAQTALSVTVTNTGNQATGTLTVGTSSTSFTLSKTSINSIAAGNQAVGKMKMSHNDRKNLA